MSVSSLWASTAASGPAFPTLDRDVQGDVVIIGGGYTGLSAAHHIAKDGRRPIVIEANTVGWGASGRNGGFVSPKFRVPFHIVAARHGRDSARRLYDIGHEAVDAVEDIVDELEIRDGGFTRCGYLTAAHNERALAAQSLAVNWMKAELGDTSSNLLAKEAVRDEVGCDQFVGGVLNAKAACLHPLNYLRGMARGIANRGVEVFENSPALRVRSVAGGVDVETRSGTVRAKQAVFATNAYSDLTGASAAFQHRIIPFRSAVIATAPLSQNLSGSVLPARRIVADTKRLLRWFRIVDDRLVFGGRGGFGKEDSARAFDQLRANMEAIFPQLQGHPIEFRWSGLVAMTMDFLPHVGRLDERTFFAMGYNGTGVALSSLMGRYLAALTRGEPPDLGLLGREFRPIPFYALKAPAIRLVTAWYQLLDAIGR